ncbi:hypothetical protein Tco_0650059, partial [Tanacetum coccineum]
AMGLDESYSNIRGQILLMQPLPAVIKDYGMVKHKNNQREGVLSKPNTTSIFSAYSDNQRNYNNSLRYTRGESYSYAERRSTFKNEVYYGNCNIEGYTKAECYKLVGFSVGHTMHGKF